jgi:uncharacterized protein involved in outer membrane biogenesis
MQTLTAQLRAPPARRRAERLATILLTLLAALTLAAWQIPPRLALARAKPAIETYASTRLGRPVTIAGPIHLTLLPHPMLTANAVTIADRGDGITAKLASLRLELSTQALLTGRLLPQSLALDTPTATLPWPLPHTTNPTLAPAFTASVQSGTLTLGSLTLHAISATIQSGPDAGAFAAQGSTIIANLPWRFTAAIGAASADGTAPLALSLDSRATYAGATGTPGTAGTFTGTIHPNGAVTGTLSLHGPDLSALTTAPAAPWRIEGPLTGTAQSLTATFTLTLANQPGQANVTLALAPLALTAKATLTRLALGDWTTQLLTRTPAIPTQLDLSATAATLAGATLQSPHLILANTRLTATATLPGAAPFQTTGALTPAGYTGTTHLSAPNFRRTLAWLTRNATNHLPPAALATADLTATITATPTSLTLINLTGTADASTVQGTFALTPHALTLDLALDRLNLPTWRPIEPLFPTLDTTLNLRAEAATLPTLTLRHATLDAHATPTALTISHLTADLPGAHLDSAFTLAPDLRLTNAHLTLAGPDAAALPAPWRIPATLVQGPVHLTLAADGAPAALATQLRADLADSRLEADAVLDITAPSATATVTLRHPGAPRLFAAFGLPHTEAWLDTGSAALVAHVTATPTHLTAQDLTLSAAALTLSGALDVDLTTSPPTLTGDLDATTLPLPAHLPTLPGAWQGTLHLTAARVLANLTQVATNATAQLTASQGVLLIDDATATLANGRLTGRGAVDATQTPPAFSLQTALSGATLSQAIGDLALTGGTIDVTADLFAQGDAPAALSGTLSGTAHGITLHGIDLPAASRAHRKSVLLHALNAGATGPLSGPFAASVTAGALTITSAQLSSPTADVGVTGGIDLGAKTLDVNAAGVRISGAWQSPKKEVLGGMCHSPHAPGRQLDRNCAAKHIK